MLRHLVRSFLLATAFSSVATAGPCRPRPASTSISTESLTQSVTSSVVPIHTKTLSNSDTISQDAATGTGASINPTDASLTLSNIYSISTATTEDVDVSTDWYPYLPISSATDEDGTSSTAAPVSFATDTSSSIGPESIISHTTGNTLTTASETASSSAISTDTTATSSDTAIETQPTLSAATDTTSTGSGAQSISADTIATSGEVDATSTIRTETTTSVARDTTVGTSGTDSSLASPSDTTTDSGEASSTTTSATFTDTTEESKATETTTTTSSDHSTAGTDSSTPTSETVSTDITMTSSETTAMSSQIDTTATTEPAISTITTEAISSDTTVTSKGTDTTTATSSNATAATETLTSTAESASTDTTATSGETATTTSGNSNTGTEASSTSEASSTDTTVTTKETDTTTTTLDDLTTTTTTDSFKPTTETALSDTTVTTTRTDTTNTATLGEPTSAVTDSFTSTNQATSTDIITISTETDTSTTITSGSSATSTTEIASTDTTVTTSGTDTSGSTTSGEPTSTATDTFTSTIEATSEITLTSSQTGTPTPTTSGDITTTDTASFSTTTEATSTASETTTAAVPACTPGHLISPPPQGLECGRKGAPDDTNNIPGDHDEFAINIEACYNACKETPECGSIIFEEDVICSLRKGKPGETDGTDTGFKWYDMGCFCNEAPAEPEPEPVCVDNSPTGMVCGAQGWPGNQCMHKVFSSRVSGFEACKEACKTKNCDSFSYRDENDECEAYQGRVGGTDGLSTPRKWYDVACFNDENTPTDPQPQCVNNALQPSPKDSVCGKMGSPTGQGREEIGSAAATSLQGCRDACNEKAGCDSFQLEEGFNCYLFKGQVGGTDGRTTSEVWYDMSCFCGLEPQPTNPDDEEWVCVDEVHKTQVCGSEERPLNECIENITVQLDGSPQIESLEACRDYCKGVDDCDSIAFRKDKYCALWKGRVGGEGGDSGIPGLKWYDMSCFDEEPKTEEPPKNEPVCINNMLSPSPKDSNCGAEGYPTALDPMPLLSMGDDSSLEACHNDCKATTGCKSFQFEQGSWCFLFPGSAGPLDGDSTPMKFYDMSCFCDGTKTEEPKKEEPAAICKGEPKNPLPRNTVCGEKKGIRAGVSNFKSAQPPSSLKDCNTACKNTAGCDAFYWKENQMCVLQSGKPSPSDFTGSVGEVEWWVPSCFCEEPETEKTTGPAGTCQNNMLTPAPQGLACAKTGIPIGDSTVQQVGQGTANTPLACYQLCKNTTKCQTMYFHKDTGDCQLYSGTVKSTNSATTSFVWYDKGCFCDSNYPTGE